MPTTPSVSSYRRRRGWLLIVAIVAALLAVTACQSDKSSGRSDGGSSNGSPKSSKAAAAAVDVTPRDGTANVAPATQIVVAAKDGKLDAVQVRSDSGDVVAGTLSADGTKWTSKGKLSFGAHYTVQVTTAGGDARDAGGFTTAAMPAAASTVRTSSLLGDNKTYGIAMPIILKLNRPISAATERAAFERSLTVTSSPATTGAWGWVNSREVHFRPQAFWAPGTKVHVGVDTAGRQLGGDLWGRTDLTVDFRIGISRIFRIPNTTKQMQVVENGRVIRTMPVSLGSAKHPSSSGTLVIIDRRPTALFDSSTYGLPVDAPGGYRTKVQYAMRLTWGGEFIHAAPWSVADQGVRNVSHGCVNVATANAKWIYDRVQVGDPAIVSNTEMKVKPGDGWTEWSVDFPTWLQRSATGAHPTA